MALRQLLSDQCDYGRQADPTEAYREALRRALVDARGYFEDEHGRPPAGLEECCGWLRNCDGWTHSDRRIGWIKRGEVYVDPTTAYEIAKEVRLLGISPDQVARLLHDRGALASTDEGRHSTSIRLMVHGHRVPVLHVRRNWLFDEAEEAVAEIVPTQTTADDDLDLLGE